MKLSTNRVVLSLAVIGVGCLAVLARSLYNNESAASLQSFQDEVDQHAVAFEREVLLNLEILYALNQALSTVDNIDLALFQRVTEGVLRRSPAIQAFAWAPWVYPAQLQPLQQEMRLWLPDFEVFERAAGHQ